MESAGHMMEDDKQKYGREGIERERKEEREGREKGG
jgi:hypothetical protein